MYLVFLYFEFYLLFKVDFLCVSLCMHCTQHICPITHIVHSIFTKENSQGFGFCFAILRCMCVFSIHLSLSMTLWNERSYFSLFFLFILSYNNLNIIHSIHYVQTLFDVCMKKSKQRQRNGCWPIWYDSNICGSITNFCQKKKQQQQQIFGIININFFLVA